MIPAMSKRREKHFSGVYFACIGDRGPVKIGYTTNIEKRVLMLRHASPCPISLIGFFDGPRKLEKEMHDRFGEDWIRAEWYEYSAAMRVFLADHKDNIAAKIKLSHQGKIQPAKDAKRHWLDRKMTKRQALAKMDGWTELRAKRAFGPRPVSRLRAEASRANAKKGGRPRSDRQMPAEEALGIWKDTVKYETNEQALIRMPGWNAYSAYRYLGPSGRSKHK